MLQADASVTAIEPGAALAVHLHRRWTAATIHIHSAETAPLRAAAFDFDVAATTVHWLDLDVVVPPRRATATLGTRSPVFVLAWSLNYIPETSPICQRRQQLSQRLMGGTAAVPPSHDFDTEPSWPGGCCPIG